MTAFITDMIYKTGGQFQRTGPLLFWGLCCFIAACSNESQISELSGQTMGTSYSVQIAQTLDAQQKTLLQQKIETELNRLDQGIFSTWTMTSETSRFNRLGVSQSIQVSPSFIEVMNMAAQVEEDSDGAFDVTIAPLVFLWGFGPGKAITEVPDEAEIRMLLDQKGLTAIVQESTNSLVKLKPRQLDFSAIAKGYAVDRLAVLLDDSGIHNYLVEIGGEVLCKGARSESEEWRLAIEQPDSGKRKAAELIGFNGQRMAVAGSGNYRNFVDIDGHRYSHEIDPRTGYPAENSTLAVTVIHSSAALADAWATAFMVMEKEKAFSVAEKMQLPIYLIVDNNGVITSHYNDAFEIFIRH